MPGITISASYGAGGSAVAPAVAARLGWTLVDRALSSAVAEQLAMPVAQVEQGGPPLSRMTRFLLTLAPLAPQPLPVDEATADADAHEVRMATERLLHEAVATGAVVLGRAGACALQEVPDVLRVRLYGPVQARVAQAARLEDCPRETAARRRETVDAARDAYVGRLYGRSADESSLYHLQLDSTALSLDACVDLVVQAHAALVR